MPWPSLAFVEGLPYTVPYLPLLLPFGLLFVFKHKTAYEMRISDWSSDVCSSDLGCALFAGAPGRVQGGKHPRRPGAGLRQADADDRDRRHRHARGCGGLCGAYSSGPAAIVRQLRGADAGRLCPDRPCRGSRGSGVGKRPDQPLRSEEHTSELQSLMRISYAVFCLKKKKKNIKQQSIITLT